VAQVREQALDRAVRVLARRDHSIASLSAKLARAGVDEETQADVVDVLVRAGYLDDGRFARARAAHLAARGYGDDWIRADLDKQGVPRAVADEAVAGLVPERERALERAGRLGDSERAARTLGRRGFSPDSLEAVCAWPVADDPPTGVGYDCSI
jgi:regulatory protein